LTGNETAGRFGFGHFAAPVGTGYEKGGHLFPRKFAIDFRCSEEGVRRGGCFQETLETNPAEGGWGHWRKDRI